MVLQIDNNHEEVSIFQHRQSRPNMLGTDISKVISPLFSNSNVYKRNPIHSRLRKKKAEGNEEDPPIQAALLIYQALVRETTMRM